jgi:hypothetical protein
MRVNRDFRDLFAALNDAGAERGSFRISPT